MRPILRSHIDEQAPGRFGRWRQRSSWNGFGRRTIPKAAVINMWNAGMTAREISDQLGKIRGAKFCPMSIARVLMIARRYDWTVEARHALPVEFVDRGISKARQRALGL